MSDPLHLLEQRLAKAYADQAMHYDRAFCILERENVLPTPDAQDEAWILELQNALNEVGTIDNAMAEDKLAWQQSGRSPSASLRKILDGLAKRIGTLAEFVDRRVAVLNAKRHQVMPELDGFIRQRRMLKAYDQYGRLGESAGNDLVS